MIEERRPKRKSSDIDGHVHELTFTCYRRQPFLSDDDAKSVFLDSLRLARKRHGFLVWAYVVMPEHVHLLVAPRGCLVRDILRAVKQPVSQRIIARLRQECSPAVKLMESGGSRGNSPYTFWQSGGGYDRNLYTPKVIWSAIEYIHMNPVRRGLVENPEDWPWSSCRFYRDLEPVEFELDRCDVRTF